MNVEAYRRSIRRRMRRMAALGVGYAAATLAMHVLGPADVGYAGDFLLGVLTALACGFALMMPRYRRALRDDQALRRLWNREHDERLQAIRARAGVPLVQYTSVAMIGAALLINPWNMTVAVTLLAVATTQLVVSTVVKLVCLRSM